MSCRRGGEDKEEESAQKENGIGVLQRIFCFVVRRLRGEFELQRGLEEEERTDGERQRVFEGLKRILYFHSSNTYDDVRSPPLVGNCVCFLKGHYTMSSERIE